MGLVEENSRGTKYCIDTQQRMLHEVVMPLKQMAFRVMALLVREVTLEL